MIDANGRGRVERLGAPARKPIQKVAKLGEQRRFVLWWWDEQEKNPGGNPSQTADGLLPVKDIPILEDFGLNSDTVSRWRKRLADPEAYRASLYGAAWRKAMAEKGEKETRAVVWTGYGI